jgi:hypothetical protein
MRHQGKKNTVSALGQKQTYALQQAMSALHPIATAKADMPQMVMYAACAHSPPPEAGQYVFQNVTE